MGGFRITKIGQWVQAQRKLRRLATANLSSPLKAMGEHMLTRVSEAFEEERSPAGEKWPASKRAAGKRGKTLQKTGRLKGSVAYRVVGDSVHVGTNVVYGAIHNFGGKAGRGAQIPQRTFLEVTEDDREELGAIMDEFLSAEAP